MAVLTRHEGPLPPPADLAAYEQVVPGLAERLVKAAESQTRHRHRIEKMEAEAARDAAERFGK